MKVVDLRQRSQDWLLWRAVGLGGSDAPVVVNGSHFGTTRESLWEQKRLHYTLQQQGRLWEHLTQEQDDGNWAMREGQRREEQIRSWYEELVGRPCPPCCCVHEEAPFAKASLDGWDAVSSVVLEIKYANKDDHRLALDGTVPRKYVPQVDHLLWVTGGEHCDYISFNPRFPLEERFALVRVTPSPHSTSIHALTLTSFWLSILHNTPPQYPYTSIPS